MVLLSLSLIDGGPEMVMTMSAAPCSNGDAGRSAFRPLASRARDYARCQHADGARDENGERHVHGDSHQSPGGGDGQSRQRHMGCGQEVPEPDRRRGGRVQAADTDGPGCGPLHQRGELPGNRARRAGDRSVGTAIAGVCEYPDGAVLAAVMYITSPLSNSAPPDPGGCLTQWHVHTNLCFARLRVVGIMNPTCPAGSVNRVDPADDAHLVRPDSRRPYRGGRDRRPGGPGRRAGSEPAQREGVTVLGLTGAIVNRPCSQVVGARRVELRQVGNWSALRARVNRLRLRSRGACQLHSDRCRPRARGA